MKKVCELFEQATIIGSSINDLTVLEVKFSKKNNAAIICVDIDTKVVPKDFYDFSKNAEKVFNLKSFKVIPKVSKKQDIDISCVNDTIGLVTVIFPYMKDIFKDSNLNLENNKVGIELKVPSASFLKLKKIDEYQKLYDFTEIIPVSARKKDNVERLLEVIKKYLPDNIQYYDSNTVTDSSPEFVISEFIREKVLDLTEEEVPHSVTCIVESIEEDNDVLSIGASIVVDRENLKKIIIGKNGSMIKEIGIRARKDIEEYFGKKVYLDLFVKVVDKWRDKEKFLNMIGYKDFLNK